MRSIETGGEPRKEVRKPSLKQRAIHELKEFLVTAAFLAVYLGALANFERVVLTDVGISYTHYGVAVIAALVLGKVILIGDAFHLQRYREGPLITVAGYQAVVYGLLILAFKVLEHVVRGLVHGEAVTQAFVSGLNRPVELAVWAILSWLFLFSLFALRGASRLLGEDGLVTLLFKHRRWEARAESEHTGGLHSGAA